MCVISMVHDSFEPRIPQPSSFDWTPFIVKPQWVTDLEKLLLEFKECVEAAKKIDILTKQPDCLDPNKAKLQERVNELEHKLQSISDVVKSAKIV